MEKWILEFSIINKNQNNIDCKILVIGVVVHISNFIVCECYINSAWYNENSTSSPIGQSYQILQGYRENGRLQFRPSNIFFLCISIISIFSIFTNNRSGACQQIRAISREGRQTGGGLGDNLFDIPDEGGGEKASIFSILSILPTYLTFFDEERGVMGLSSRRFFRYFRFLSPLKDGQYTIEIFEDLDL